MKSKMRLISITQYHDGVMKVIEVTKPCETPVRGKDYCIERVFKFIKGAKLCRPI